MTAHHWLVLAVASAGWVFDVYGGPLMAFFVLGMHAGYAIYFPELFPTRLRATGSSVCFNMELAVQIRRHYSRSGFPD